MKEIVIDDIHFFSKDGGVLCVEVTILHVFREGKYWEGEVEGVRYTCVIPSLSYHRIEIRTKEKVPNQQIMDILEEEPSCSIVVRGFRARISGDYVRKELRISCSAEAVFEANDDMEVIIP